MNTDKLDSLDEADRAAVLNASGEVLSRIAGQAWDIADQEGLADAEASGNTIVTASDEIATQYMELVAPIEKAWIEEAGAKGIDAAAALAELREIARSYKPE
jgi:TRAP-type C4-dicarboxylate transport system substrate-binding protein